MSDRALEHLGKAIRSARDAQTALGPHPTGHGRYAADLLRAVLILLTDAFEKIYEADEPDAMQPKEKAS